MAQQQTQRDEKREHADDDANQRVGPFLREHAEVEERVEEVAREEARRTLT